MRSRPKVKVFTRPKIAIPGQPLFIDAVLTSRSETPVDLVLFTLTAVERISWSRSSTTQESLRLVSRHTPGTLHKGDLRLSSRFDIPPGMPAAYAGGNAALSYVLTCHVSIPWWIDREQSFAIPVGWREAPAVVPTPALFASSAGGPSGKTPYVELALESTILQANGVLVGAVSVSNSQFSTLRRVSLALVGVEEMRFQTPFGLQEQKGGGWRYPIVLHEGAPEEGASLPFRLPLPKNIVPTFNAQSFGIRWGIEVSATVAWGADVRIAVPIVIAPPSTAPAARLAQGGQTRWASPVGRERRALVWEKVAERSGMTNDVDNERMRGSFGPVTVVIRLEHRGADGIFCVAQMTWEALGVELCASEREWIDAFAFESIKTGDRTIDRRFTMRARESAQARAFFQKDVLTALAAFAEARVDDDGATVASKGGAQSAPQLEAFVAKAIACAKMLAHAVARVPPPEKMASFAPAWSAFASRVGGRFAQGAMAIHRATIFANRVDIDTLFWSRGEARGEALATRVVCSFDPPLDHAIDLEGDGPEVSALTREIAADLRKDVQTLAVDANAIDARLKAPLEDPASLEILLEKVARLSRSLRGMTEVGPFR